MWLDSIWKTTLLITRKLMSLSGGYTMSKCWIVANWAKQAGFIRLCNGEKHAEVVRELNGRLWNGLRLNLFINPKPTQTHHLYKKKITSRLNSVEIERLKEHISELEKELAKVKLENESLRAKWSDSNQSLSVDELLGMGVECLEAVVLSQQHL